jgi:hypothetical protein
VPYELLQQYLKRRLICGMITTPAAECLRDERDEERAPIRMRFIS